jgi:RNA polymerase sigma factor (sigma-70 family)
MISNKDMAKILRDIFSKWFKRNRKLYFRHFVDEDELFNKIISMEQHLIDESDMFLKWKNIYDKLNDIRQFEFYMGKVFRNSVLQFFREEKGELQVVAGESAQIKIESTKNNERIEEDFEVEDLVQKITELLHEDIKKDKDLRKILKLISLYYLEGRTLEKISKSTGLSIAMVFRQIHKGLLILREKIEIAAGAEKSAYILNFKEHEKKIFSQSLALLVDEMNKKVRS